ncbi:MAG: beta-N-acetylhexosaminidase, partial [Frankiaceae bacterium]|nr:beta-N-acetylhexosaminidase [Frankiaceae bacterium]
MLTRRRGRRIGRTLAGLGCAALAACSGGATTPAGPTPLTTPKTTATGTPNGPAARVAAMSLEQQIGQLLLPQVYGSSATDVTPAQARANQALLGVATPAEAIRRYSLAGVTLLGQNTTDPVFADLPTGNAENPKQLRALTDGLTTAARAGGDDLPLVIAIDQEGGVVDRLHAPATEMPAAMAVGATGAPDNARAAAAVTAAELCAVGVTVDLAPVADLASLPTNTVIGTRSYGADPASVGRYVTAAVAGLQGSGSQGSGSQGGGVAATLKHFPGHGGTDVDSHLRLPTLPQSRAQLDAADLVPFRAGIDGGVDLVMTGNLRVPAIDGSSPASLSRPLITDVLRRQLGFDGVVITDALSMGAIRQDYSPGEAAVRAVDAGADLLSISANTAEARSALLDAVGSGRLSRRTV